MNKRSVTFILTLLIAVLLITSVTASIKPNRGTYTTKDSVYILSTVGVGDNLCRSQNPTDNVKVYIVDHKSDWDDGDSFEDVRGSENEIPNEKFSNTKIWDNPKTGIYDLVVDCDEDSEYDEASEPIYSQGFEIVPKKGQGSMALGHRNPEDFEWQYDPENEILTKVIMQIELKAMDENLILNEIKLDIKSPQEANNLEIYFDKNNNGILDKEDENLAKQPSTQKEQTIPLDFRIRQDIEENFIIVFNNNENTPKGDYQIKIVSIGAEGEESEEEIKFFGNPLTSNKMKVIDKKTCIGEIELDFTPNPSGLNEEVLAEVSGLTGCDDLIVKIKSNECHVAIGDIDECVIETNECGVTINAIKGTYFACADKDGDGTYEGFGESKSSDLEIKDPKIIEENALEINDENNEKEDPAKVTGNVIGNLGDLELNNTLVILVEITLLLILAFLALILYRIIKPEKKEEVKEDDSDIFEEVKEEINEDKVEDEKDEIFEEIEEKKKEIVDKVEKDKKTSKKK